MAKYLNLAGLQTLWAKLKDTFAPKSHNHSADDINSGTLPISRGGTGATTTKSARQNILSDAVVGLDNVADRNYFAFRYQTPSADNGAIYYRTADKVWNWIKSKLGISSAVGSTTNPVYVDSNGQLKAVGGTMLKQGSIIDTHPESSGTNWLDGTNEWYAFYDRGGTCTAYEYDLTWDKASPPAADLFTDADLSSHATTTAITKLAADLFNSRSGYTSTPSYSGTKFVIYDLALPASLSYSTRFFYSFGNGLWSPAFFEVLVYHTGWDNVPAKYTVAQRFTASSTTGHVSAIGTFSLPTSHTQASGSTSNSINRIRIVMSKWSRISCFGATYYGTKGLGISYMSRTTNDEVYRTISPAINNKYDLGSSAHKWANVYATNFNGALKGNADTATLASTVTIGTGTSDVERNIICHNGTSLYDASGITMNYAKKSITATTFNGNLVGNASTASAAKSGSALETAINGKANAVSVTGATKCKVTYNSQGVITAGADLAASDIPSLAASKITSGTFADDRIASASKWNAKQDALTFDTTPTESSSNPVTSAGVKSYVDSAVTGLYKYRGSVNTAYINALQNPSNGDVYNINASGTITNGEGGQPMSVLAGDNVAFVLDPITSTTYWDKMSSELDLSNFVDFDDIATATTAGVVKSSSTNGKVSVDASGVMTVNGWNSKQDKLTEMTEQEVTDLINSLEA